MRKTVLILATLVTLQSMGGGFYSPTPVDVKGRNEPKPLDDAIASAIEAVRNADERCKVTSIYNSGESSPPEYGICVNPDGTMSQIYGGNDNSHVNVPCQEGGAIVHTHGMETWTCVNEETGESGQCYTALGPSPADIKNAIEGKLAVIAVDCASGLNIGVDKDGRSFIFANGKRDYSSTDFLFEISIDGRVQVSRYSDAIAKQRLEKALQKTKDKPLAREGQPIDGKNNATWESIIDTLHSLADLLETGEDIVEVREDMRKDRRERKAKEKAERERKAAEEERLRQQQGQKSKNEPKKSQPSSSASIDFTKLNNLISQQVSFLKGLLASGEEATPAQHAQFNSLNSQYANEFNRLKAQIDALPDSSQRSQYYSQLASVNSRMNSEVDPLLAQGERAGIFKNL